MIVVNSPVGPLLVHGTAEGLQEIRFADEAAPEPTPTDPAAQAILERARAQLTEYFAGARRRFDLPLAPAGTAFQRRVWAALREIPYGHTESYGELAARLGKPTAARAVGLANGRNPLPVVVPCHRVIGTDGSLTGYAGGLAIKRQLLELEGVLNDAVTQDGR